MIRIHKTPGLLRKLYPQLTWTRDTDEIYLTFDDGPQPDVTEWVLEQLDQFHAKATFFCVGENIFKHSDIASLVLTKGHKISNHTYNHLNGWNNEDDYYLENIVKCESFISGDNQLFRPPYGRIKKSQINKLDNYEIIMWSHLAWDFDSGMNPKHSIEALSSAEPGSILVFHDSYKSFKNLKMILPEILENLSGRDLKMNTL